MIAISAGALLSFLNPAQIEAVTVTDGPELVLSGAGTGKTRVLVTRIAYLIGTRKARADQIMALTFTNKAAAEMRDRLKSMRVAIPQALGTFHSVWRRFLTERPDLAGLADGFTIAGSAHQRRVIRNQLKHMGLKPSSEDAGGTDPVRRILTHLDLFKGSGLRPQDAEDYARRVMAEAIEHDILPPPLLDVASRLYPAYQAALQADNMADFNDLMLWPTLAMREDENQRRIWAGRFTHILIDEFQDTSTFQFEGVRLLAKDHQNVCAVGDDDQSIYGWRQADIDNILRFSDYYPTVRIVRMTENYRCSAIILAAANAVIANNALRLGKVLTTPNADGDKIVVADCPDDRAEADFVAREIERLLADGIDPNEVAVLYRSNYLSRGIQERLVGLRLPHEVVGDPGFYAQAEVRDAIAYLRMSISRDSAGAFERVCNRPNRGIGAATLQEIEAAAFGECSLFEAARTLAAAGHLRRDAAAGITALVAVLDEPLPANPGAAMEQLMERSGYRTWLQAHAEDPAEAAESLTELIHAAERWPSAAAFLGFIADMERAASEEGAVLGRVKLMSGHRSKGLEFDYVFLIGWEEGTFPSQRADTAAKLEEDRRLAYVELTRGRKRITISSCRKRWDDLSPSRFLEEIPEELTSLVEVDALPAPVVPPTAKQLEYCALIARRWGLTAPHKDDHASVRLFLDTHAENFKAGKPAPQRE
jgi:DNA helicase-2/ATP-dependent DNA helicase PcrA